jgi:tetratricopeptide (TPR) repeat protein/DNA-binding CsgD family transcriptional regulator
MKKPLLILVFFLTFQLTFSTDKQWDKVLKNWKNNNFLIEDVAFAEKILQATKNEVTRFEIINYLGIVYKRFEIFDKSYFYLNLGFNEAKKIKALKWEATFSDGLGSLFFGVKNYKKSNFYYKHSVIIYKKINDFDGLLRSKGNLALLQVKNGNKEKTITLFEEIIRDKNATDPVKIKALLSIGNIYLEIKKPSLAISYYNKIISIKLIENNKHFKILLFSNLAECYLNLKQYSIALKYLKESEILLKQTPSVEFEAGVYKFYSEIYKQTNQFKLAYESLLKFNALNDTFLLSKDKIKFDEIEMMNELRNNEKNIILKEQKIQLLTKEKSNTSLRFWITFLLLILLFVLIFVVIKINNFKLSQLKKYIVKTEGKMDYIQTNSDKMVLGIYQINDFLEGVKADLKIVNSKVEDTENKNLIKKVVFDIQNFSIINDYKEKLLNKVDAEFLYKLKLNFVNLTEEETKICTLVFLELKNKDIAAMLNLSVRSIENHRYRIGKKINVSTDLSLYDFLKSL